MGRSRRYQLCPSSMRSIAALQILRDHVIRPIVAGVCATDSIRPRSHLPSIDSTNNYASTSSPFRPARHRRLNMNNAVVDRPS
jgi:hypothetical protein